MTCAELGDVATELALGVLTGRERAAALAHLDSCEACREEVRQLMATNEQLLALLPPAEPPAGFETRVLDRLGLSAPAAGQGPDEPVTDDLGADGPGPEHGAGPRNGQGQRTGHAELLQAGTRNTPRPRWRPDRRGTRPSAGRPGPAPAGPGGTSAGPGGTSARPGGTSASPGRTGRVRRALAATAVGLAVIAAGLGGWRIGTGSSPATSSAAAPLTSASLLSATHRDVGDIYLYSGTRRWLYMSVYLGSGNERVTCQVIGADGKLTTIGSFRLNGGYGGWGSPAPSDGGSPHGAQLVSADGTVLATATFTS
jgi:hypothetical protein